MVIGAVGCHTITPMFRQVLPPSRTLIALAVMPKYRCHYMINQGRRSRRGWGALAPPLLRRMTFYFVLVYGTYKEIKKKENKKTKEFSSGYSPKEKEYLPDETSV